MMRLKNIRHNTGLWLKHLFAALLCILLCGCSLAPESKKIRVPGDTAKSFYGDSGNIPFSCGKWWNDFSDPYLSSLVNEALAGSPDMRAAMLNIEAYKQQAVIVSAPLLPDLSVSADASRNKVNLKTLLPVNTSYISNSFSLSLNAAYEIDLFKKLSNAEKQARLAILSARENQKTVYLTLISNICNLYFKMSEQRAELESRRRIAADYDKLLSDARQRYLSGMIDVSALAAARQEKAGAEQAVLRLENLVRALGFSINALAGRDIQADVFVSDFTDIDANLPRVPAGLPSSLLSRRPDVRAAEEHVRSALLKVGIARAALLPSLRLTASTGYRSSDLSDLIDHYSSVWALAGGITAPLFNRGAKRAAVKQARIEADIAVQKYISTALSAFKEVNTALSAYEDIKSRLNLEEEKLYQQKLRFKKAEDDYISGIGTYTNFLKNRILLEEARISKNRVVLELLQNRVQLMTALGGGFPNKSFSIN